jgi:hypothetical protein
VRAAARAGQEDGEEEQDERMVHGRPHPAVVGTAGLEPASCSL